MGSFRKAFSIVASQGRDWIFGPVRQREDNSSINLEILPTVLAGDLLKNLLCREVSNEPAVFAYHDVHLWAPEQRRCSWQEIWTIRSSGSYVRPKELIDTCALWTGFTSCHDL